MFLPVQVYWAGIDWPDAKALLVSVKSVEPEDGAAAAGCAWFEAAGVAVGNEEEPQPLTVTTNMSIAKASTTVFPILRCM